MFVRLILWALGLTLWITVPVAAQTVPSAGSEVTSTGFYRDQDTLPGVYRLYQQQPKKLDWLWSTGPYQRGVRKSSFKKDVHIDVANYSPRRLCTDCHRDHSRDMHMTRVGITCVQCHRDKPIDGVYHYYSSMNPIRRHAYVCAKCHEGATPSFASYVVHEPNPLAAPTREDFPALYYATWFMVILAGGVFVIFIPYVVLWGVRELVDKLRGGPVHDN
ncbi:MAG: cytochrome c3 family protein [Gammaproteobacteria bacterium]|nr:cytochrome c3 family protein [Gammaproteobacteria bacterium]